MLAHRVTACMYGSFLPSVSIDSARPLSILLPPPTEYVTVLTASSAPCPQLSVKLSSLGQTVSALVQDIVVRLEESFDAELVKQTLCAVTISAQGRCHCRRHTAGPVPCPVHCWVSSPCVSPPLTARLSHSDRSGRG